MKRYILTLTEGEIGALRAALSVEIENGSLENLPGQLAPARRALAKIDAAKAVHQGRKPTKAARDPDRISAELEREHVRRGAEWCARCHHPRQMHSSCPPHPCEVNDVDSACDCPDFEEKP